MSPELEQRRLTRLGELVAAVARQALADWRVQRIALLDDGSPEVELAAGWLQSGLPAGSVTRVTGEGRLESLLHSAAADPDSDAQRMEARRLLARLVPDALVALPANKTALLLGGPLPPDPFLPLADLYASEVQVLTGGWSAPAPVRELAERVGGIDRLDDALRARIDQRGARGLERLPPAVRGEVEAALAKGSASRLSIRLVPKIGHRTLGADLFE